MTSKASPFLSDVVRNTNRSALPVSAPVQLREEVHTYLSLAKLYPDLHPAVLAAILARPSAERRALLEAARASAGSKSSSPTGQAGGDPVLDQDTAAASLAASSVIMSSDSDEVWEDAVEDLNPASKKARVDGAPDMATVVVGDDVARLEKEAADSHRAWQETRQLGAWTRYVECRRKMAELRKKERYQARQDEEWRQQEAKWSQLAALREVHEGRLAELTRRRERLRLSRQYHEQTRLHHAQLAQAQLHEQLRQLEERQQLRRLQHLQRVQQLVEELAVLDRERQPARRTQSVTSVPTSTPSPPPEDVFTHMWDDFSHWEKMVSDDKENVDPSERRPASCSNVFGGNTPSFSNQPDLIPVLPSSAAGGGGVWRHGGHPVGGGGHPKGSPHAARRHSVAADGDGYEERKKWFERALLCWHAQDDEEHFGTSLYASSSSSGGKPPLEAIGGARNSRPDSAPLWHNAAWPAWAAPVTTSH